MKAEDFQTQRKPTWCPGCGNYGIWASLKDALLKAQIDQDNLVSVFGIGCSGNMADFLKCNGFHALHGRAIPTAIGVKIANHKLKVIVIAGDGDTYGEGGNHLIHGARGNHDITVIVHDNKVYGLTTGQVSPTASKGYQSKSTPLGVIEVRDNPLAIALSSGASFVAQGFAGDIPHLTDLLVKGLNHRGFSLINILQPCVTFNKVNTAEFYQNHTYKLDQSYKPNNKIEALNKVFNDEKLPLGVLFDESRSTYTDNLPQLSKETLVNKRFATEILNDLYTDFY